MAHLSNLLKIIKKKKGQLSKAPKSVNDLMSDEWKDTRYIRKAINYTSITSTASRASELADFGVLFKKRLGRKTFYIVNKKLFRNFLDAHLNYQAAPTKPPEGYVTAKQLSYELKRDISRIYAKLNYKKTPYRMFKMMSQGIPQMIRIYKRSEIPF